MLDLASSGWILNTLDMALTYLQNVPLTAYSTMRLGGTAAYLVDITSRNEIPEALQWAEVHGLRAIMIGMGSNIFWWDGVFNGLVMVNKIKGFVTQGEQTEHCYITIGAGEDWDEVVAKTVDMGLSGIEFLSLIPGTAGATPVQNVGAYGREIKDTLVTVEAYDKQVKTFVTLRGSDCGFGYRTSRFKTIDRGRFFISGITLHLIRQKAMPPFYPSLQRFLDEHGWNDYQPSVIRRAVISLRQSKLPDPRVVANNGSFFANPVIDHASFSQIQTSYPGIPHWKTSDGHIKLSAAWLVEQSGFKDYHDSETGMATWSAQPLVFVNENATSTAGLLKFKQKVYDAVKTKFGISLQQEPELIA